MNSSVFVQVEDAQGKIIIINVAQIVCVTEGEHNWGVRMVSEFLITIGKEEAKPLISKLAAMQEPHREVPEAQKT